MIYSLLCGFMGLIFTLLLYCLHILNQKEDQYQCDIVIDFSNRIDGTVDKLECQKVAIENLEARIINADNLEARIINADNLIAKKVNYDI